MFGGGTHALKHLSTVNARRYKRVTRALLSGSDLRVILRRCECNHDNNSART
jgi:hypothetical protein